MHFSILVPLKNVKNHKIKWTQICLTCKNENFYGREINMFTVILFIIQKYILVKYISKGSDNEIYWQVIHFKYSCLIKRILQLFKVR